MPALFGNRNEIRRGHHTPLRVRPAQQRLGTDHTPIGMNLRLVKQQKLAQQNTPTDIFLQGGTQ